ncbi:LytTR family DNA-binding domain-containing protein [Caulobacter sp. CCH9-E1]|jgi:DNA-binding LytR/AlgR family response regulator|uniref:LytR/AlgR family response regulator transcription factor n=1 Tax=Caulobacter sp. CCH9-E1 TaxID=1768768 RepID=UPI0009EADCFC|nr:LytTR family DNA-binding domain-containing protein [Caulobacter sp. CCH9-E1]
MLAFTAYSWLATTLCAAWFARRFAANDNRELGVLDSLVWQGGVYAAWLPTAAVVWLLLRRYGSGAIGHLALYLAGALIVPLESLVSAMIDTAFAPSPATLAVRTLARMPISLLLYTAIVAVGLAAAHHRRANDERDRARALEIALSEAREALARASAAPSPPEERLIVMSGSRRVPVEAAEVEWFGAADNYVVVHWSDREGLLRSTLQALEERLDGKLFARCHRSALVNLARVTAFAPLSDGSWRLTMESGAEVVTSRSYRRELLERLGL